MDGTPDWWILIIRRITGGVLGDVILLHATLIAKEEHIINLLLVFTPQFLLLGSKPHPKLL